MSQRKKINNFGLTLMEMLISVALLGMVSLAIYKSLSIGIDVWKRNRQYVAEEDIAIFFEKITHDLQNTFVFSLLTFEGSAHDIEFPTFVRTLKDERIAKDQEYVDQIGKVKYAFDPSTHTLYRSQSNYGQSLKGTFQEKRIIATSLSSVQFRYFYITDEGEAFSAESLGSIPLGVEVLVEIDDVKGKRQIKKFISLPGMS